MARTPITPTPSPDENSNPLGMSPEALALFEQLAEAQKTADALTPKPRNKGPRKLRTHFDTDAILAAASLLPGDADWLALLDSLGIDDDSEEGPKIRTRISQLINADRLSENFRPIAPGEKPLYLAKRNAATIAAQLAALGFNADGSPLGSDDTENAS
jgi:hypothetical protein